MHPTTKQTVVCLGTPIGYLDSATQQENDKPALVCLHGNSLAADSFSPLYNSALCDTYRLLAFDRPGHSASGSPTNPEWAFSFEGLTAYLLAFVEALHLRSYVVVGHSLGGTLHYKHCHN